MSKQMIKRKLLKKDYSLINEKEERGERDHGVRRAKKEKEYERKEVRTNDMLTPHNKILFFLHIRVLNKCINI